MFSNFFKVKGRKNKKAVKTNGLVQLGPDGFNYFDELDNAYLNSPTATMALLKFHEFCIPDGLLQKFQKLWKKIENDYIRYGYYLIYVEYDVDANPVNWCYLNPRKYRISDVDDNDNASTIKNVSTGKVYPVFNSNKAVVKAQFEKDGFEKFPGQIYMYNDSSQPYRITPLFSVFDWMKTEANASTYVDKACDNAMFGNNIFVIKKSSSASDKELEVLNNVKEALSSVKGVEEASQNLMIEYEGDIDDVTKLLSKISISNDVNVDLLNASDDKAESKICMACYGFPAILVKQNDGVFGNSGEALAVATREWSNTCKKEAQNILDGFKEIGFKITEDVIQEEPEPTEDKTLDAQAVLKGSVGGVQALLEVQASYAAGTTSYESAIAILELIFGFDNTEADRLLGSPEKTT